LGGTLPILSASLTLPGHDLFVVDRPLGDTEDIPDGLSLRRGRQPVEEQRAFRVTVLNDNAEEKELLRPTPSLLGLAPAVELEPKAIESK
jgi:hypothetical protein